MLVPFLVFGTDIPSSQYRVKVTQHRTSQDWAYFIRELVDIHYPKAEKIVLVLDNLNTHTPSSLYSTFAPAEARRILSKLELHYTPVHGSWLNMAEIELSALALYWLLGSSVQKQALRDGEKSPSLLANTGGLVYNPKSSTAYACSNDNTLT